MAFASTLECGCACVLVSALACGNAAAQPPLFVAGSTTPRVQLTGEHFQIFSNGRYFTAPTPAQTLSTSGILGTDIGFPVSVGDKTLFLFGDSVGAYPSGGKYFQSRTGPNGAGDSIGYISNVDLSQCRYIGDVDQQLAQGIASPTASPGGCPVLRLYNNPSRAADEHVFKPIVISGLLADEGQGTFRTPQSGFVFNDRLYLFYTTRMQDDPAGRFILQSILAKSDQAPGTWSDAAPPTFSRVATVSSHPQIVNPATLPPESGDAGKFIFNAPVVMSAPAITGVGSVFRAGLPPSLQNATNVVLVFGSSFRPTLSNLYLAAFDLADAEAGPSKWFYYKGGSQWSASEVDAAPLLSTNDVSNHSVVWNAALHQFVLLRNTVGSVVAQFASTPWGPWGTPVTLFSRNDAWGTKLMHHPGADPLVQSLVTIYDKIGNPVALPDADVGVPYAPNLLETFTRNADGSVVLYYTVSLWNPYQVLLMSSTFVIPGLMTVDKTSLQFAATNTGAAFVQQTQEQTVRLLQTGDVGRVTWTATANRPWITVSPSSGSGSATLTVRVQFANGLPIGGATSGTISLTLTGAANTVGPITVGLTTIANGASAAPTGVFDTPGDGTSGVTGSIAVTGWAVDDIEVSRVRILRDPVPGEGPSQVFIGTAVFVDGSRPDVASLNPGVPRSTRAGWGYLLLTNFLPSQGNGTFTLAAYADDTDGHSTLLGRKTITCSNATAARPFGAIDTPAQGEVISGASYNNFGWVLARGPALAYPPNGTVQVVVDGVFGATPSGWTSRSDLTTLFPAATYPGVTNALGVSSIDTTALANGVHTIAWVVTADNTQADGIGSRYFTVANGSNLSAGDRELGLPAEAPGEFAGAKVGSSGQGARLAHRSAEQMQRREGGGLAAPVDRSPITGRRGWDERTPLGTYEANINGRIVIDSEELDRIELRMGVPDTPDLKVGPTETVYSGYLRIGNALGPLPIGSRLDPATGEFTWQPGVGFVHAYDLVFVRWAAGQAIARREVRIVLNPKRSSQVGPQIVVDAPASGQRVAQPFVVAGWAIDLDAVGGTGVDTLHVWAYPVGQNRDAPIFVGAAAYGGRRGDVGAIFGERFTDSGYSLTIDTLPQGTYDLAVFGWSAARNRFLPAKVVRVTVSDHSQHR